jgi:plastocyanin
MPRPRSISPASTLLLVSLLVGTTGSLFACSKSKSGPTAPGPGALELNSGAIAQSGGVYAHRFFAAGTFAYHCTIHPGMMGSVVVSGSAPAGDSLMSVSISGFAFNPPTVTIPVNGKVTWTNNETTTAHTVTSN